MLSSQTNLAKVAAITQEVEYVGDQLKNSFTQERRTLQKGRSLGWCFTLHNYTVEHESTLKNYESQFLIYGKEVTPKNGVKHLQGFIQFAAPGKSSYAMHKLLPSASWFTTKGCIEANIDYCSKMGNTYYQG